MNDDEVQQLSNDIDDANCRAGVEKLGRFRSIKAKAQEIEKKIVSSPFSFSLKAIRDFKSLVPRIQASLNRLESAERRREEKEDEKSY